VVSGGGGIVVGEIEIESCLGSRMNGVSSTNWNDGRAGGGM